jgi:alpha-tubulin suppressor-like RCC1 family protein
VFVKVPNFGSSSSNGPVKQVACGGAHTVILTENNEVFVCGRNQEGQLGIGNTTNLLSPQKLDPTTTFITPLNTNEAITHVACGDYHTMLLTNSGKVYGCGLNSSGQLGINNTTNSNYFRRVYFENNAPIISIHVSCGSQHSAIIGLDSSTSQFRKLYACGRNTSLGIGAEKLSTSNTILFRFINVQDSVTGYPYSTTLKDNGVYCGRNRTFIVSNVNGSEVVLSAGDNNSGCLGNGTFSEYSEFSGYEPEFKQIDYTNNTISSETIANISTSNNHTMLLTTNNKLYVCGLNNNGQFGITTSTSSSNKFIDVLSGVNYLPTFTPLLISASTNNSHVVVDDGSINGALYSSGLNFSGEHANNSKTKSIKFIRANLINRQLVRQSNSFTKNSDDVPFNVGITSDAAYTNSLVFSSSDNNIATVNSQGIVTINSFGEATITGSLTANGMYANVLTDVILYIQRAAFLYESQTMSGLQIKLKSNVHYDTNVNSVIKYTPQSFSNLTKTKYLRYTGFRGVLNRFSVNGNQTDFTASPWTIELSLPNVHSSDYNKVFKLYKVVNNALLIDANYPRDVTYDSGIQKWVSTLPTFSDFVVVDETPPDGILGGDPYLLNLRTKTSQMLSNLDKEILIYDSQKYEVYSKLERLSKQKLENMSMIKNGREIKVSGIDLANLIFKYVTELIIIDKESNGILRIDCYDGSIIEDNKQINYEEINSKKGLSDTMSINKYYPKRNLISYNIYLENEHTLILKVDNYWSELNNIKIYKY